MRAIPKRISLYALCLSVGIVAFLGLALMRPPEQALSPTQMGTAVGLAALIALAGRFPLHVSSKTQFVVDTSLIFAALLAFPMPVAPLICASGVLLGLLLDRNPLLDTIINLGVTLSECVAAQAVYLALGGSVPPVFTDWRIVGPLLGGAATMIGAEGVLVALAVSLYQGTDIRRVLFTVWRRALKEDVALILLGILIVLVVQVQPWALLLAAIPVGLVYLALRNSLRLEALTQGAVESLADVIDRRDPYTAGHSLRVSVLSERLAQQMGLPWEQVDIIRAAARVHDLGKLAVDGAVLTKPAQLSPHELGIIRRHPAEGAEIVERFPEFTRGADYVRHHHEHWDGSGYPGGLKGVDIPQGARIIAVADAYDAMTSDRPYRKALDIEVVIREFQRGSSVQWDEPVVEALLRIVENDRAHAREVGIPTAVQV